METIHDFCVIEKEKPIQGILIQNEPDCEIWFPYSLEAMKLLQIESLICVKNIFSVSLHSITGEEEDAHYSILRVIGKTARHFLVDQVRNNQSSGPVSIEQLVSKFEKEWKRSINEPEENNLRIVIQAKNTNTELYLPLAAAGYKNVLPGIQAEQGEPILGEIVYLLGQDAAYMYLNNRLGDWTREDNSIIALGAHKLFRNPEVPVCMDSEKLFQLHFGVYGSTGSGKSNMLSTLISKVMQKDIETNLVIFDVNNEYFGLLFDVLLNCGDAHLVFIDESIIGNSMQQYLCGHFQCIDSAAEEFIATTTFSNAVNAAKKDPALDNNMLHIVKWLLYKGRIKMLLDESIGNSLKVFFVELSEHIGGNHLLKSGEGSRKINEFLKQIPGLCAQCFPDLSRDLTAIDLARLKEDFQTIMQCCAGELEEKIPEDKDFPLFIVFREKFPKKANEGVYKEFKKIFEALSTFIDSRLSQLSIRSDTYKITIGVDGLFEIIQDGKKSVVIVLGSETNLRNFAHNFGNMIYDYRKNNGITGPLTSFLFEEADVFIPGKTSDAKDDEDKESFQNSRRIATTLARRGRKYGLGLGISTQRIIHLDTTIMTQLQTYFVSRLPREADRKKIAEGFGIEDSDLDPNLNPGEWILLSQSALGQKGEPVPVRFENADDRLLYALENFPRDKYQWVDFVSDLKTHRQELVGPVISIDYLPYPVINTIEKEAHLSPPVISTDYLP